MLYGSLSVSPASGGSRSLPAATRSAQPRNPGRGRPSVSTQRSPRIPGSFPRVRSSVSANAPAATTIAASQFASRLASPDSWSSGLIGTTTTPVFAAAQYVSSSSRQLGSTVASLSPFPSPAARSPFARRLTRALNCRDVRRWSSKTTARWSGRKRAYRGRSVPMFTAPTTSVRGQTRFGWAPTSARCEAGRGSGLRGARHHRSARETWPAPL